MTRRLPPLNAVRAFEAAARHLSFTKAAKELNVTQAAISHQVKSLEADLGVVLFRRLNRSLRLTDTGQALLPPVTEAFELLTEAFRRIDRQEKSGRLRVSVLPSFAARWLLPRLGRFRELHPEIDVLIAANDRLIDLRREDVDLAVRYGRLREWPGCRADRFMNDEIFPVCSPRLLEGPHALRSPDDLRQASLLHDKVSGTEDDPDWRFWLERAGVTGVDPDRGLGYSDAGMVIQAAVEGQGVALARSSLADDEIAAGRLIMPFGPILVSNYVYHTVSLEELADRHKVKAFREWLLDEARRMGGCTGDCSKGVPSDTSAEVSHGSPAAEPLATRPTERLA